MQKNLERSASQMMIKKLIEEKNEGFKETRRWDDGENATVVMRRKEEGSDYRLSVEGDIPYITGKTHYVRPAPVYLFHNFIFWLIDGKFLYAYIVFI